MHYREDMDSLTEGLIENEEGLASLTPSCHPQATFKAYYRPDGPSVLLACVACGKGVIQLGVASRPCGTSGGGGGGGLSPQANASSSKPNGAAGKAKPVKKSASVKKKATTNKKAVLKRKSVTKKRAVADVVHIQDMSQTGRKRAGRG